MADNLIPFEHSDYQKLQGKLKRHFPVVREKTREPDSKYLCDPKLKKIVSQTIDAIASYLLTCKQSMESPTLGQYAVRPLSILLLGPPGTGKTTFVDTIGKYLDDVFKPDEEADPIFRPHKGNIAEFEHLEALGQILIGLRNRKIDANFPPILFLDEADADPKTFLRLLTVLWDGKFFWGEHRRDLGAMIIFLAVSSMRCKRDFLEVVSPGSFEEIEDPEQCASTEEHECHVSRWACTAQRRQEEKKKGKGRNDLKHPDLLSPWEQKGSDFLSRVNGPIIILDDLAKDEDDRWKLFQALVRARLKELHLSDHYDDSDLQLEFIKDERMQPRYSARSLQLLAESLNVLELYRNEDEGEHKGNSFHTITEDKFSLMSSENDNLRRIHFPGLFESYP